MRLFIMPGKSCRDNYCVNKSTSGIYTDMAFHAKTPFVPLFRLVHLRVPLLFDIFGRAWGVDNGSTNNDTALHHMSGLTII